MAQKEETLFQNRVQNYLKAKKWKYIKVQQIALIADPDLVVCVGGRYVELELKASIKSRVEKLQVHKLSLTNKGGGYGLLVYPENWDAVKIFLGNLSKRKLKRQEVEECLKLPILN